MKTAVEWIVEQFNSEEFVYRDRTNIIQQAKEMEKQQVNNAFHQDRDSLSHYEDGSAFEEYYNETFKKK
jgi:hypothetical protein